MATATVYCGSAAANGIVNRVGIGVYPASETPVVAADTNTAYQGVIGQWLEDTTNRYVNQYFLAFDLSGIAAGSDVSEITFSLNIEFVAAYYGAFTAEVYAYDWGTLEAADWRTAAQLVTLNDSGAGLVASFAFDGASTTTGVKAFTTDSGGLAAVEAACGGTLLLMVSSNEQRAGTDPYGGGTANEGRMVVYMASRGAGTTRPRLDLTYTEPAVWSGLIVTRRLQG